MRKPQLPTNLVPLSQSKGHTKLLITNVRFGFIPPFWLHPVKFTQRAHRAEAPGEKHSKRGCTTALIIAKQSSCEGRLELQKFHSPIHIFLEEKWQLKNTCNIPYKEATSINDMTGWPFPISYSWRVQKSSRRVETVSAWFEIVSVGFWAWRLSPNKVLRS